VVGQQVELECHVVVMANYDLEEVWTGPRVSTGYRVDGIAAEVVTQQRPPEGADELDPVPQGSSRILEGLSSTRHPECLAGETVSDYLLTLTPRSSVSSSTDVTGR
jgi:hypothetical protein